MNIDYSKFSPDQLEIAWKIYSAAIKHGVSPNLALAQGMAENRLIGTGTNSRGATGIMQVKQDASDEVFRKMGIRLDPKNPEENIELGVLYMKVLGNRFGNDPETIARAYNAGPTAYANDHSHSKETNKYIDRVKNEFGGFSTVDAPPRSALDDIAPTTYVSPLDELALSNTLKSHKEAGIESTKRAEMRNYNDFE